MRRFVGAVLLLLAPTLSVQAEPFSTCSAKGYLTQSAIATTYGVNLSTGEYSLVENDMGTKGKVNGLGFNPNDNYVYGWSYVHKLPARFGSDWQVEPLDVDNIANTNFFVGDVSYTTNEYIVYRRGARYGLYAIGLDPLNSDTYLQMRRIVSGAALDLRIFDIAFHPSNGLAYAVDRNGKLFELDTVNGVASELANVGERGTFGIDIDNQNYSAELFAHGPASSINDGARCALAPIMLADDVVDTDVDYGDAPESYGTYLTDNGARHGLTGGATLYLGDLVDGESDGSPFPMSDDKIDGSDDDDGVQFATGLLGGESAVLLVKASDTGYLNAWIDFNQSGEFDNGEQIVTDRLVGAGSNTVFINVSPDALAGKTWARFRVSSTDGIGPNGGVSDGEVEDYEVDITSDGASVTYYPSSNDWATIAFEDNWPIEGDYDMNDLVVYLRTAVYRQDNFAGRCRSH